jgi:hypothetical protein
VAGGVQELRYSAGAGKFSRIISLDIIDDESVMFRTVRDHQFMPKNKSSQNGSTEKWGTLHIRLPRKLISRLRKEARDDGRGASNYAGRLIQRAMGTAMEPSMGAATSTGIQEQSQ